MAQALDMSQFEMVTDPGMSGGMKALQQPKGEPLPADGFEQMPSYANGLHPETPVNQSPVTLEDRFKLQTGNEPGKIAYLKKRYEDARMNADGDLVVKSGGLWHRVDPTGFGDADPWTVTKKILSGKGGMQAFKDMVSEGAKDVADLADVGAAVLAQGTVGGLAAAGTLAATANPALAVNVGRVAGAAAAGGVEAYRTSLGRLMGTYQASDEEKLRDVGWETALTLAGEYIPPGAKLLTKGIGKAFEKIADTAAPSVREHIAMMLSELSGEAPHRLSRAISNAKSVTQEAEKIWGEVGMGDSNLGLDIANRKMATLARQGAEQAEEGLYSNYRKGMADVIASTPKDFKGDMAAVMKGAQQGLVDQGLGTWEVKNPTGNILDLNNKTFRFLTPDEVVANINNGAMGDLSPTLGKEARERIGEFMDLLKPFEKADVKEGKQGAHYLMEMRRVLNAAYDQTVKDSDSPFTQKLIYGLKKQMDAGIDSQFAAASPELAAKFGKLSGDFSEHADFVRRMADAVKNEGKQPGAIENLVREWVSKAGSNTNAKDMARDTLAKLVPNGDALFDKILDIDAAKALQLRVGSASGNSLKQGMQWGARLIPGVSPNKPRDIGRVLKYSQKTLDWVKGLPQPLRDQIMQNPMAASTVLNASVQAADGEDHDIRTLLESHGVPVP